MPVFKRPYAEICCEVHGAIKRVGNFLLRQTPAS